MPQSTLMFKTNLIDLNYFFFFILNNSQDQTLLIEINLIYDFKVSVHSFFVFFFIVSMNE